MNKPLLLDLFCGGGGASVGYARAGYEVIGVDIRPQPHYPFRFIQEDVFEYLERLPSEVSIIHASPPCQLYTRKPSTWGRPRTHWQDHPDLFEPTRNILNELDLPYVLENVIGSPIEPQLMLCGTMFGLRIRKHRLFESNYSLPGAPSECTDHSECYNPWRGKGRTAEKFREAQGINWLPMTGGASRKRGDTGDLYNAIPPAYTEWIGSFLMPTLREIRR